RRTELVEIRLSHARKEIEALRVDRHDGPKASDCCDAVRCECAAGERMRPSAGQTPDGEAIDFERIRDGANVVGDVGNGAAGECFGPAVAGPVVAHESNPSLLAVT